MMSLNTTSIRYIKIKVLIRDQKTVIKSIRIETEIGIMINEIKSMTDDNIKDIIKITIKIRIILKIENTKIEKTKGIIKSPRKIS